MNSKLSDAVGLVATNLIELACFQLGVNHEYLLEQAHSKLTS
jgi:hypothetical protein